MSESMGSNTFASRENEPDGNSSELSLDDSIDPAANEQVGHSGLESDHSIDAELKSFEELFKALGLSDEKNAESLDAADAKRNVRGDLAESAGLYDEKNVEYKSGLKLVKAVGLPLQKNDAAIGDPNNAEEKRFEELLTVAAEFYEEYNAKKAVQLIMDPTRTEGGQLQQKQEQSDYGTEFPPSKVNCGQRGTGPTFMFASTRDQPSEAVSFPPDGHACHVECLKVVTPDRDNEICAANQSQLDHEP